MLYRLDKLLNKPQTYNFLSVFLPAYLYMRRIIKGVIGKGLTLDCGCGTGHLANLFPVNDYIGVDKNLPFLHYAHKKKEGYRFINMDVAQMGFKEATFDNVLFIGVVYWFSDSSLEKILLKIKCILKTKGRIIIVEPAYIERKSPVQSLIYGNLTGRNIRTLEEHLRFYKRYFKVIKKERLKHYPFEHYLFVLEKP